MHILVIGLISVTLRVPSIELFTFDICPVAVPVSNVQLFPMHSASRLLVSSDPLITSPSLCIGVSSEVLIGVQSPPIQILSP